MNYTCKVKHVFPGGNTTKGFFSYFDQILPQDEANHIFSIKGGPGVGKSSLMKKIGKKMTELDFFVEYHHCSSDPNSLDALVIPELKVALMDGTSPHIVDPYNPGAVDEIINLGEYWQEQEIRKHKKEIMATNAEIKQKFAKAYQYLKAAKEIYDTYEITEKKALNQIEYYQVKTNFINEIFTKVKHANKLGKKRHLFSFGLTPIGITQFRDTIICNYEKRYVLNELIGINSEEIMNEVVQMAINKGLYVECYHSPIKVEKIEDILLPEINISISVNNHYNKCEFDYLKAIDLTQLVKNNYYQTIKTELNEDQDLFEVLLYKGLNYISKAKKLHDALEAFYVPYMNFNKIDQYLEVLIAKILSYKE